MISCQANDLIIDASKHAYIKLNLTFALRANIRSV